VNDAVAEHLAQRAALERGFGRTFVVSGAGHVGLVGVALLASWLGAPKDTLRVAAGIAVPVPAGGGGPMNPDPAPPAPQLPTPPKAEPRPEPPPPKQEVIKPPKDEKKGLPPLEAKKPARKPTPTPPPRAASTGRVPAPSTARVPGVTPNATGTNPATPGLGIVGPVGPGVPGGTDPNGDWYLASVQRKIWVIWTRQMKTGFMQPITVALTIRSDGSLEDGSVRVVQSGGTPFLDLAAQRAVYTAAPFAPFPRTYGTNRITIQAVFQPTP
jgi:TonB family protein